MKIWVDVQLSPAIAVWMTENFADVQAAAVRDVGLRNAEDEGIFFAAREAAAAVMTKDSDFVDLQVRFDQPPKIIWMTCGNTSNKRLRTILMSQLSEAIALLERGERLVEIAGE